MSRSEDLEWIRQIPFEELLSTLDEGIYQHEEKMRLCGYAANYDGTPNRYLGHVSEEDLSETLLFGTIRLLAWLDHLVELGHISDKEVWPTLGVDELDALDEQLDEARESFDFPSAEFAQDEVRRALGRMRRRTKWIRLDGFGWKLSPEGMAHLDGMLEEVVLLEPARA